MMSFRVYDGRLPESGNFGMCQALKEGQFRWVIKNFARNPSAIRPTPRPQAGVTPAGTQLANAIGGLQDLSRQQIGINDVEAQLRKTGGRCGLAATDTARESDDHAPPYRPHRPRANLKRGWEWTAGLARRRRQESPEAERCQPPEQPPQRVQQSASEWSRS